MPSPDYREDIKHAVAGFSSQPLPAAARSLFATLGYSSQRTLALSSVAQFRAQFDAHGKLSAADRTALGKLTALHFLFQLTDAELSTQNDLFTDSGVVDGTRIHSYLFFAAELPAGTYSRTDLTAIARAFNKPLPMPALVLFKHGDTLSLAVLHRRLNKVATDRDVLEKATLIKDIRCAAPHRAHVEILADLAFDALCAAHTVTNFVQLHAAWRETLDIQELNKRFYQQLQHWYFWALGYARFPADAAKDAKGRDSLSLIRLLTRLIFVWFLKEKGLVPENLFDARGLPKLLKGFAPANPKDKNSVYYRAVLQNLFFATLNCEQKDRGWAREGQNFMAHSLYRHRDDFASAVTALDLFKDIPFLNGGLFECLDKDLGEGAKPRYVRIDGFSRREDSQPVVPDFLFFGPEQDADLSDFYEEKKSGRKSRLARVRGLLEIFHDFKFTIEENTPLEEDVALDPELLGRVFENLLAAYNPETQVTARKQTGSFYTPREIVDYMTGQALFYALREKIAGLPDLDTRLPAALAQDDAPNPFNSAETGKLIAALDDLKILDPACGSGAFPMGVLHRLVHLLQKLDPGNARWKKRQLDKAAEIPDATVRERVMADIEQAFGANELNYGRKLYLVENCLYGVDIQPIAAQITKLRFFISLVVEQRTDPAAPNRGIRPLPNLETKIVAANTLLGIARPGQQLLRNLDIDIKEAELRHVRDEHFLARTPKKKAKCREEDARLRKEIAALLKDDGWDGDTAKKLSAWDPYDQNAHADFFDNEWMFGLPEGFDVVIANPPYVRQEAIKELKPLLKAQGYECFEGAADLFVYFYERAVELLAPGGVLSFISSNKYYRAGYGEKLRAFLARELTLYQLLDFGDAPVFEAIAYASILVGSKGAPGANATTRAHTWQPDVPLRDFADTLNARGVQISQSELKPDGWWLVSPTVLCLLEKLRRTGKPLGEYVNGRCYWGIKTGDNEAFVVDRATRDQLIREHKSSADILKPFLRGRDVKRWRVEPQDLWLIFTRRGIDIKKFPAIYEHLLPFKKQLMPGKPGGRKPGSYEWYELQDNIAYWKEFEQTKLVVPAISGTVNVSLDREGFFSNNKTSIFVCEDAPFVSAIVNSKVAFWFTRQVFATKQGGFYDFEPRYSSQWPIPTVSPDQKKPVERLVDQILAAKRVDAGADTSALEAEIDRHVYALYGLTPAEIKIVEESGK